MKYTVATTEQADHYIRIAKEWMAEQTRWNTAKVAGISAVAEYLANQDGLTLYK